MFGMLLNAQILDVNIKKMAHIWHKQLSLNWKSLKIGVKYAFESVLR